MKSLKHLAGVLLFALLSTLSCIAGSVGLMWDANPPADNVTSYIVHYGNASTVWPYSTNAGTNLTVTVTNLAPNTNWFFVVTAKNAEGLESDPSNEIWLTMPDSNVIVRTIGATNMTRTNVALVGVVTNVPTPYSCYFEYDYGTNWNGGTNIMITPLQTISSGTGNVITAIIPVVATNYVCRLVVTNTGFLYVSQNKAFRTVPPTQPTQIKFQTTILQTTSITSTNWQEVMTASVLKDYPPDGVGFLRSRMDYSFITNYPPNELIVEPIELADAGEPEDMQPMKVEAKFRSSTPAAAPPSPGN